MQRKMMLKKMMMLRKMMLSYYSQQKKQQHCCTQLDVHCVEIQPTSLCHVCRSRNDTRVRTVLCGSVVVRDRVLLWNWSCCCWTWYCCCCYCCNIILTILNLHQI